VKKLTQHKQPTTYKEIVQHACDQHARRVAELKRAEKLIRAIESDLTRLNEANIGFDVGEYSMRLEDVSELRASVFHRAKWALYINAGSWAASGDTLIAGFLGLGWIVESGRVAENYARVVLRKLKTQTRVTITGRPHYVATLLPKESA
jgi:hypothetical protein